MPFKKYQREGFAALPFGNADIGDVGALTEEILGVMMIGLQTPEFGGAFVEYAVGFGAGSVDGALSFFDASVGGFHGIGDGTGSAFGRRGETGFDLTAAAEAPGGDVDFLDQILFEGADGGKGDD